MTVLERSTARRQRSQAIVEFALVAPLLLLFVFGVVDFGRVIYVYVTLNQAVNEGARAAIVASAPLPSNTSVETAVKHHAVAVSLANPCPNGPITSSVPPANTGYLYITEAGWPTAIEPLTPNLDNAPGGQTPPVAATATCSATDPASGHVALQVTIVYNFVPFTPLIQKVTGSSIVIKAAAIYKTEY